MKITIDDYCDRQEELAGYCLDCDDLTVRGDVGPLETRQHICPECGSQDVFGMEAAQEAGYLEEVDHYDVY